MTDCIIIGSGVAGISAALTLKANGKSFLLFGSPSLSEKIEKAEMIRNYPGLSGVTGKQFVHALQTQLADENIEIINEKAKPSVFLLWGSNARSKKALIDQTKHLVLESAHPSPLSAYNGFFGCKHFSKTNEYLEKHGLTPIDWDLTK